MALIDYNLINFICIISQFPNINISLIEKIKNIDRGKIKCEQNEAVIIWMQMKFVRPPSPQMAGKYGTFVHCTALPVTAARLARSLTKLRYSIKVSVHSQFFIFYLNQQRVIVFGLFYLRTMESEVTKYVSFFLGKKVFYELLLTINKIRRILIKLSLISFSYILSSWRQ